MYDDIGAHYEDAFRVFPQQTKAIQWLLSQLSKFPPQTAKCLDIGCGTGRPVCSSLADAGHLVHGIDISAKMVAVATQNVRNVTFKHQDLRAFAKQAEPGSWDAITVFFSMGQGLTQNEIREYVKQMYGWLKTGGLIVWAGCPTPGNNISMKWMGRQLTTSRLAAEELTTLFEGAGFDIVSSEQSKFLPQGVEAGICGPDEAFEEQHIFIWAVKR